MRKTFEFMAFEEFSKRWNPALCDESHVSRSSAFVDTPQVLRDAGHINRDDGTMMMKHWKLGVLYCQTHPNQSDPLCLMVFGSSVPLKSLNCLRLIWQTCPVSSNSCDESFLCALHNIHDFALDLFIRLQPIQVLFRSQRARHHLLMEGLPFSDIPSTPMSCADLDQYQFPFPAEGPSQQGGMASTSAPAQMMGGMANGGLQPVPTQAMGVVSSGNDEPIRLAMGMERGDPSTQYIKRLPPPDPRFHPKVWAMLLLG